MLPSAQFGSDSVVNEVMGARMAQLILQCTIVQLVAVMYSAVQFGTVQCIDVHPNTVQCIEFRAVQCSASQCINLALSPKVLLSV